MKSQELKFNNISISGGVGTGSSTVLTALHSHLEPLGFTFQSTGEMFRRLMNEYKQPFADGLPASFNTKVEDEVRKIFETREKYCIDGWLAGFVARDLDNVLKVLLYVTDEDARTQRVAQREHVTPEEARKLIDERETKNFEFWKSLYGDFNFWDPKYYTLAIDTTALNLEETLSKILETLGVE